MQTSDELAEIFKNRVLVVFAGVLWQYRLPGRLPSLAQQQSLQSLLSSLLQPRQPPPSRQQQAGLLLQVPSPLLRQALLLALASASMTSSHQVRHVVLLQDPLAIHLAQTKLHQLETLMMLFSCVGRSQLDLHGRCT
jgi:hypothetical protein